MFLYKWAERSTVLSCLSQCKLIFVRFAKGKKPGLGTGFDIDEADLLEMEKCHNVVVASAIFGKVFGLSLSFSSPFDGLVDLLISILMNRELRYVATTKEYQ